MISVAIATLDRPEMVRRGLESIVSGTRMPDEVIVVDGSAGDRTLEVVEAFEDGRIRHARSTTGAASSSRNQAVELADSDYVAFVDDDCVMPPAWIEGAQEQLRIHRRPDALYGAVRAPDAAPDRKGVEVSTFTPRSVSEWAYPVEPQRLGYSNHMIVRRSSFRALGGFDERFGPGTPLFGAEDIDYGYRLLKAGHRVVTTPAIWVVHEQWRPQEELPGLLYRYNLGHAAFCAKHLRTGDRYPWRLFAIQVGGDLKMLGSAARRRSWLRARVSARRALGSWVGLARGWRAFAPGA